MIIERKCNKFWYLNGQSHSEDGLVCEWANGDGDKEWYLEGVEYSEDEFKIIQLSKKLNSELPKKSIPCKMNKI